MNDEEDTLCEEFDKAVEAFDDICDNSGQADFTRKEVDAIVSDANEAITAAQRVIYGE